MKLNVLRADPAGNITLFVLDPVEKGKRAGIAAQLMEIPEFKAEQVGFLCPPGEGADGHMEMMGGEFCGNATRAFGLLTAKNMGLTGPAHVRIETSGCDHIVTVDTDLTAGTSRAEMPLPLSITRETVAGHTGTLVNLGGIAHFVVEDVTPEQAFFDQAEPMLAAIPGLDAYGVIFLEPAKGTMTPLVKVPATNTLVWEGSCGSGSLASALAQSRDLTDGTFSRSYIQPAGTVTATAVREGGKVVKTYIGGPVTLGEPFETEVKG